MADAADPTTDLVPAERPPPLPGGLRLEVVSGPDRGRTFPLGAGRFVVGQQADCDVVLTDARVSRRHLELVVGEHDVVVRDLASRNGSQFEGSRFDTIRVGLSAQVAIGDTVLRVSAASADAGVPDGPARLGRLLAQAPAMREVFATVTRAAEGASTVLVQGETGTGKELVAAALHDLGPRRAGPFVVCDLAGLAPSLVESELFGHVRGAFTGADRDREGAFALAHGGTLFLDEVGELPLEIQPRLLRALDRRHVKPVGGTTYRAVDVRVVSATNRDLLAEVRAGRFRQDLYFRLAVVTVTLPPLRARPEDIALLTAHFLAEEAAARGRAPLHVPPALMAALAAHDWPGNVRELRNVLERAVALSDGATTLAPGLLGIAPQRSGEPLAFKEAKERLIEAWEREYLSDLWRRSGQSVSGVARRAGVTRGHARALLRKHGLAITDTDADADR